MKFTSVILGLVAAVAAQNTTDIINQIPGCALLCVATGTTAADCNITDYACLCSKKAAITAAVTPCLTQAGCTQQDIAKVTTLTDQLCRELTGSSTTAPSTTATRSSTSSTSSAPSTSTTGAAKPNVAGRLESVAGVGVAVAFAMLVL